MSKLFSPLVLGSLTLSNRVMISPMCQYSAIGGVVQPWHHAQYGRLAMGGAGLVMVEMTSVSQQGLSTHGDLGLWTDEQEAGLAQIASFIRVMGAVPAIQLGHAGRKASSQRPWHGGKSLGAADMEERCEAPWPTVAPSAVAISPAHAEPNALTVGEIDQITEDFVKAARRAIRAGFDMVELHAAHGYLLNQFLSPLSNTRDDQYGRDLEGRMRLPVEIAAAMKAEIGNDKVLSVRLSVSDGVEGGSELPQTLEFAKALKAVGVDILDCSSGGIVGAANATRLVRGPGFQVPFADALRKEVGLPTIAVGLIFDGPQAEAVLQQEAADLIAIGRAALEDPNWPHHARAALDGPDYASWPVQAGWWLQNRAAMLERLAAGK
jgi:2,4-dienoyl-CoA reductase-like NADH-dependent reductase (Old Yellow Enzyme family)